MIKIIIYMGWIVWALLLSSCSLFPDKEKQYLQSAELEHLELPPDLNQSLEDNAESIDANLSSPGSSEADQNLNVAVADKNQLPILVDVAKEPLHIQIFEGFDEAWRTVGKTLAHMGLEVLDRDEANGQYFVVYEEASEPVKESFWTVLAFWRDENQHEEFDFRVKLLSNDDSTSVLILDASEQPVVSDPGRELLQSIYQSLSEFN
jgi:outer membrane protein assembly factor BamC